MRGLSREVPCGATTRTIGEADTRISLSPDEISTITWNRQIINTTSTVSDRLEGDWTVIWNTTTVPMTWSDLAACASGVSVGVYSFPANPTSSFVVPADASAALTATPYPHDPCRPVFAMPTRVTALQPAWQTCFPDADGERRHDWAGDGDGDHGHHHRQCAYVCLVFGAAAAAAAEHDVEESDGGGELDVARNEQKSVDDEIEERRRVEQDVFPFRADVDADDDDEEERHEHRGGGDVGDGYHRGRIGRSRFRFHVDR
ncbi:hypothetical protein UCDDS831_g09270 [Diplodia seriata]|uniref:Uncharacterized protein n=1 Tax=Diplodia seriata TaxID=420778 RepID=A0A0G2G7G9_9PEZI|nr:hypothetical protein UCDDS831_g09270 [Diplodia seriata]